MNKVRAIKESLNKKNKASVTEALGNSRE